MYYSDCQGFPISPALYSYIFFIIQEWIYSFYKPLKICQNSFCFLLQGKYYVYNHIAFTVEFHHEAETDYQKLVGLFAEPVSVVHTYKGKWNNHDPPPLHTCSQDFSKYPSATNDPQVCTSDLNVLLIGLKRDL